jgi:hypothetical protein
MTGLIRLVIALVNHPGAAGSIAATVATQAAPDSYTLFAPTISSFLAVPGRAPNLPLMVPRNFAAVGLLSSSRWQSPCRRSSDGPL